MKHVLSALMAGGVMIALGVPSALAQSNEEVGPGCDPTRPAVAYHPGGTALKQHNGNLPIPCVVVAGETTEMATVGVSQSDGALFYAPQTTGIGAPPAVTRSRDDGATWQVQAPPLQPGTISVIPWMDVDPETNRVWFAMIGPYGTCPPQSNRAADTLAQITWSDDEGATWHSPPGDPAACRQLQGEMSVVEGPAPHGQPQPHGYPHVVYHCGNVSDVAIPLSVHCWKSLDGGQTWSFVQGPNTPPSDCTSPNRKYGGRGRAVGPDGTLYMSVQCLPTSKGVVIAGPGPLYLASSGDEGNTWSYQLVVNTSTEVTQAVTMASLAIDQAGNLYIAWVNDNNQPLLIVRKASGWGSPMNIAQPGVNYVTRVAVAVNEPGHVALAYAGSTGGIGGTFNGYIAESNDALGANPTFVGASVNDPSTPLMSSAYAEATTAAAGRMMVITDTFGRDGTPWAAFHCGNMTNGMTTGTPTFIMCPNGAVPPAAPLAFGVVGRLARDNGQGNDNSQGNNNQGNGNN